MVGLVAGMFPRSGLANLASAETEKPGWRTLPTNTGWGCEERRTF
jgi:hypothetical protein